MSNRLEFSSLEQEIRRCSVATKGNQSPRCFRPGIENLADHSISALLRFDFGDIAKNSITWILVMLKQTSNPPPFTINADQTDRYFTLNQYRCAIALIM
jgi:hypothetical protein